MGGAIPGSVVLGSLRMWAEQALESKTVSSTSPGSLHQLWSPGFCLVVLFEVLSWLPSRVWDLRHISQLAFGHHSNSNLKT